jgi:hypothetical protein
MSRGFLDVQYGIYDPFQNPTVREFLPERMTAILTEHEAAGEAAIEPNEALRLAKLNIMAHHEAVSRCDRLGLDRPPAEDLQTLEAAERKAQYTVRQLPDPRRIMDRYAEALKVPGTVAEIGRNASDALTAANAKTAELWDAFSASFTARERLFGVVLSAVSDPATQQRLHNSHWSSYGFGSAARDVEAGRRGFGKAMATPDHVEFIAHSDEVTGRAPRPRPRRLPTRPQANASTRTIYGSPRPRRPPTTSRPPRGRQPNEQQRRHRHRHSRHHP